jgi:predicted Zn finger-like uncharacterized protein
MPVIISCPDCGRKVRVQDEQLGKKVRCPGCKEVFTAAEEEEEAPARARGSIAATPRSVKRQDADDFEYVDEEDDRPRRRDQDEEDEDDRSPKKKLRPREGWKKVRLGLTFYLISIFVFLGGMVLLFLVALITVGMSAASGSLSAAGGGAVLFGVLGLLIGLAARGLWTAGMVLCMFVPNKPETPLRLLGILSMSLCGANLLFWLLASFVGVLDTGVAFFGGAAPITYGSEIGVATVVLEILALLCGVAWFIVFILFLRAVATDLRQYELASTLMKYLISVAVAVVLEPVLFLVGAVISGGLMSSPSAGGGAAGGLLLVLVLCASAVANICLGIWHIVLVFQVRGVVDRRVKR